MKTPARKMDWKGLQVRTLKEMQNHYGKIPRNSLCVVKEHKSGLRLETVVCPHCQLSLFITGVNPKHVKILPNNYNRLVLQYNEKCYYKNVPYRGRILVRPDEKPPYEKTPPLESPD